MALRWQDIFKILKTTLMVLIMVLNLAACTTDKGDVISGADLEGEESELDEQQRACWQAGLLQMFYDAMGESSVKAYPYVTKSAMPFMMVAFAVWLSIRLLKHVSSVVEESPAEVWTEVGRMAAMCVFCGLLASSTNFLLYALNTFILPVYYTFLEYGSRVLELSVHSENVDLPGQMLGETCLIYTNSLVCAAPPLEPVQYVNGQATFPNGPADLMNCLVCATSDRMQMGFLIAKEMLGAASLTSWLAGLIVFVIFLLVKISFVTYLVDSIFRMNIVVIILPFLILAIPFKATRRWSKQGMLTIFNSAAVMMCLAIIATMAMLAMQTIINDNIEFLGSSADDGGKVRAFKQYEDFGPPLLSIVLIAFLVLKSCGLAVSLANSIVGGGGNTNFQKKIAKLAAWTAKGLFLLVTLGSGATITKVLASFQKTRKIQKKMEGIRSKSSGFFQHIAGRDQGGGGEEEGEEE